MKLKYILSVLLIVMGTRVSIGHQTSRILSKDESNFNPKSNNITLSLDITHIPEANALAAPLTLPATTANTTYYSVVDPATRTLNTSYMAGTTQGALNVSQVGSATYAIPINVMSGAGGLTPTISLMYSSNSGFGMAGYGWQVGGISFIGRSGKNYYNDGTTTGVSLSSNDKFLLDGQRLILTSGNYGADGAIYHTEEDVFSNISSIGALGSGPEKFALITKSGLQNLYGYTVDGKQQIPGYNEVLNWYVTQTSDLYGNLISYSYLKDNNMVYPSEINYGPNKITFTYTTRTDVTYAYLKGQKIQQTLLLDKITVAYNNNVVRSYQMKYNLLSDNYNSYSVLNEVIEFGTGSNRLNSTVFSYQTPANVSITRSDHYTNYDKIKFPNLMYSGDFNGDGKADLLCVSNEGGGMSFMSGAQTSSSENQELVSEATNSVQVPLVPITWSGMKMYYGDGNDNFSNQVSSGNIIDTGKLDDLQLLDINGDGKDDILYEIVDAGYSTFYYMLNNGTSFGTPVSITVMANGTNTGMNGKNRRKNNKQENDNQLSGVDYDGDGVNDILINNPNGDWGIYSFANASGQLTSSLIQRVYAYNSSLTGEILSGDFNGDGKPEIWSVESTGTKIYSFNGSGLDLLYTATQVTSNHFFTLGDFNADGKTDIFLYGNKSGSTEYDWSNWQVQLSTGVGFEQVTIAQKKANLKNDNVRLGDFNGDGCTDVLVTSKNQSWTGTWIYVTKNRGADFYGYNISSYPNEALNYNVADFNGDGRTDYICTGVLGTSWTGYQVYKSTGNTSPLLDKVANGLNNLSTIAYTKLSQAGTSVYQQGAAPAFPVYNYQGALPVVSTLTQNNGTGSSNSMTYYYEGAKMHRQGKGFLCFSKVTATDATAGLISETSSEFSTTYFYPQENTVTTKTVGGATIQTTTNNWTQLEFDALSKLIFPYVQSSTVTNSLTGFSVTTTTTYDDRGNPSYVVKNYNNGVTETIESVYVNAARPSGWNTKVIDHSTVTYSKAGETTVSKTIRYTYSTDGIIKPDGVYYYEGTPLAYTQNNDYDSKGNLTQTVTSGTSIGTSQMNYTYDTNGIRVLTLTDALGHVTTNTYDTYGRLYTMTDYLNNVNTYGYDALGRQSTVSNTNGSQVTNSYVWSGTNKPTLGVFGVTQTGNDGSVATVWYDKLGRAIRTAKKGFGGTMILTDTEYNNKGQVYRVSDPYFAGGSVVWIETYTYDGYGRSNGITRNTGRNTTFDYTIGTGTVAETTDGKTFSKTFGSDGTLTSATDNGGTINYTYFPDGKVKNITAPGSVVTSMQYADAARNQTQMVDPSAGTIAYTYDSFGRVKTQTNARSQTTTVTYLADGRTDNVVTPEGTTTYSYNTNKQLTGISSPNSISSSYGYDTKGRVNSITETIAGAGFSTSFTYDSYGRLSTRTHPSAIVETLGYNSNGYLATITAGGSTRYTITSMNAREQLTGATYGSSLPLLATYGFDSYGYPSSTATGTLQDYRYTFSATTGNLSSRQNFKRSLSESFGYDNLERLTTVTGPQNLTMTYASNGNLSTKSDIGTTAFTYGASAGPYALTGVTSSTNVIPPDTQTATYNSFEKVTTLAEGVYSAALVYNADNQRAKMTVNQSGSAILTRWYAGGSYMKETAGSVTKEYTYLGGDAYSAPVAAVTQSGTTTYYYLLRDYLGNITHQVNTSNTVVAEYGFDAWGRRRNPTNWNYDLASQPELFADRGFTSHEHLKWFNLVNMNGRLYDPLVGRFLNADPYVQLPDYSQNFNRYSYCLNNPLKFNDPSGYRMAAADQGWNLGAEHFEMRIGNRDSSGNHIFGQSADNGGADGGNAYTHEFWNNIRNRFEDFLNDPNSVKNTSLASRGRNKYGVEGLWVQTVTISGDYRSWMDGINSPSSQVNVVNKFNPDNVNSGGGSRWLSTLNNFNTWTGTAAFTAEKVLSGTRIGSDIGYQIAYKSIGKATKYIQPAGVGTSIVGAGIGFYKFYGTKNKTWGVYGQLGVSLLSSGLTLSGVTAPIGIGIGVVDVFGGFNGFYNYLDNQQQFHNSTGGFLIPINGVPNYFQLNRK